MSQIPKLLLNILAWRLPWNKGLDLHLLHPASLFLGLPHFIGRSGSTSNLCFDTGVPRCVLVPAQGVQYKTHLPGCVP